MTAKKPTAEFTRKSADAFRPTTLAAMIDDLLEHNEKTTAEALFKELVDLTGLAGALNYIRRINK